MAQTGIPQAKVGLFGIGLDTYWPQFDGLLDRLKGYQNSIAKRLAGFGAEVVDAGMVDNPVKAREAADLFKREDVSIIFLYVSTYALSNTVLPVVQKARVPVIVLNLQPVAAIDYAKFNALGDRTKMTGEWLAHCQACSVPEISNVFHRAGVDFHQVTGILNDDPIAWDEIQDWIQATRVATTMSHTRLGLLGHYYNGMLDIYSDPTLQSATFGCHIEHVEMCELGKHRRDASDSEVKSMVERIHAEFEVTDECDPQEVERAARTAVALQKLAESHNLGSLAYYYESVAGHEYEDIIASVIVGNTLLTGHHVPVAGEYEVKNAQAMKIMDAFGCGGSFTEFYAMDFNEDIVLMGHDGPGHMTIAEGKVKIKPLKVFHGKVGQGLSIEMSVKRGPVTLLSVVDSTPGKLKLLCAEAECVPGPILEIGNTNSRYKFSLGARGFVDAWCKSGPAHHCAIGVGHVGSRIAKLGAMLGIEVQQVC